MHNSATAFAASSLLVLYSQQGQGLHSSNPMSGLICRKNPNGQSYTSLGVITKGTVIEVNVSELGLVTPGGKVVWGKYAQVTNNPENDGCINAVLLV